MYLQQANLTVGVGRDFVKELTDISVKETYEEGHFLFRKGDQASHTYLLLTGRVQLRFGETGQVVHIVSRPGETFGWSTLVGRDFYSATAECVMPTKLRKLYKQDFEKLLEKDPANGLIFFQRLARMLGERLLVSYGGYEKMIARETYV